MDSNFANAWPDGRHRLPIVWGPALLNKINLEACLLPSASGEGADRIKRVAQESRGLHELISDLI